MAKKLYIIDGYAYIYAAYHVPLSVDLTSPSGEITKVVSIFITTIVSLIQRHKPDMLAVALDSKTPTFRHDVYPEYKALRPAMPDDLRRQIDRIEQILEVMNIPTFRVNGFEADDIIGTLARRATEEGYDSLICSKDKDMIQLVNEHTCIYDIKADTLTDVEAIVERMGIKPEQFIDCLALEGDSSDNVPGVPNVGRKTALGWIQKYGSLENLYEHIDEIKGKRGENLRKFRYDAILSKELVTIDCDVPLRFDFSDLFLQEPDESKLTEIFVELGFNRLLTRMGL